MKIDSEGFRVPPETKIDLSKRPTIVDPYYRSKKEELLLEQGNTGNST
jgi:hypothetical protein